MKPLIFALVIGAAAVSLYGCDDPQPERTEMAPPPVELPVAPAAPDNAAPVADTAAPVAHPTDTTALPPEERTSEETVKPESETLFY